PALRRLAAIRHPAQAARERSERLRPRVGARAAEKETALCSVPSWPRPSNPDVDAWLLPRSSHPLRAGAKQAHGGRLALRFSETESSLLNSSIALPCLAASSAVG